jgi:hypothetical protein
MSQLEDYARKWGQDLYGNKVSDTNNYSGLDMSNVHTVYNQAEYDGGNVGYSGAPNRLRKDPSFTSTYTGPGGTWTGKNGIWENAMGGRVSDLGGFLQKGSLQRTGSDFSQEQNQLTGLLNDPSKIQQTAGYQFDVDQGNQAINRSAAARGSLNSGGVLAELAKYGQGMASAEYGNQVNRLSGIISQKQNFGVGSGYYNELNPSQLPK